jgi:hypothetical protein
MTEQNKYPAHDTVDAWIENVEQPVLTWDFINGIRDEFRQLQSQLTASQALAKELYEALRGVEGSGLLEDYTHYEQSMEVAIKKYEEQTNDQR